MQLNLGAIMFEPGRLAAYTKYEGKIRPQEREVIHSNMFLPSVVGSGIIECRYFLEVHVDHGVISSGNKMPVISQ